MPTAQTSQVNQTYQPRATRCTGVIDLAGWQLKSYTISTGTEPAPALLAAAQATAATALPPVPGTGVAPGLGFLVLHQGTEGLWLLVDTWHGDVMHQSLFRSNLGSRPDFQPIPANGPTACVWELLVQHHESQALARHVLGATVDRERYLNDWFTVYVDQGPKPARLPAPEVEIRPLQPADEIRWRQLWQGYQAYYRLDLPEEVTSTTWARLFDPAEPVYGLAAVAADGRLVGFSHYVPHRSTMSISSRCYLHDLFADPSVRSSGIGRALVEAVYRVAARDNLGTVYWLTEHFNGRARRLYDRVGVLTPFIRYNQP